MKKPDIKPNVVIEKTYENVSDLEPAKKNTASERAGDMNENEVSGRREAPACFWQRVAKR